MNKAFILYSTLLLLLLSSCSFTKYAMRNRNVDRLPQSIAAHEVRVAAPIFSMYTLAGKHTRGFPMQVPLAKTFVRKIVPELLLQQKWMDQANFSGNAACLDHRMEPRNYRDSMWYLPATFDCMKLDSGFYHVVVYVTLEMMDGDVGEDEFMYDHISILVLLHVIKNKEILYTNRVHKLKTISRKEMRLALKETVAVYFTPQRLRECLEMVVIPLARRIQR